MVILGVDLRASPQRPSTVVALDHQSTIAFMNSFGEDDELAEIAQTHQPETTGGNIAEERQRHGFLDDEVAADRR